MVKQPPSRGIPSRESLWLEDIRKMREEWHYDKNARLELDQILQLIFPQKYQAKYYEIALNFMKFLLQKAELSGDSIGEFVRSHGYSKATFYNVILPRLKRVGMIVLKREQFTHERSKQKFYKKTVKPSMQFALFLRHVAREYRSILGTAKSKKPSANID